MLCPNSSAPTSSSAPPSASTRIHAHRGGDHEEGTLAGLRRRRVPVTHRQGTKQAGSAGPALQGRGEPRAGPQEPWQSAPQQAFASGGTSPSRRCRDAGLRARGTERTPGGLGAGHASEADEQGRALCSGREAGRPVPAPRPAPSRPLPADSCGRRGLAARRGGRRAGPRALALPLSPGQQLRSRERRPELRRRHIVHRVNRLRRATSARACSPRSASRRQGQPGAHLGRLLPT